MDNNKIINWQNEINSNSVLRKLIKKSKKYKKNNWFLDLNNNLSQSVIETIDRDNNLITIRDKHRKVSNYFYQICGEYNPNNGTFSWVYNRVNQIYPLLDVENWRIDRMIYIYSILFNSYEKSKNPDWINWMSSNMIKIKKENLKQFTDLINYLGKSRATYLSINRKTNLDLDNNLESKIKIIILTEKKEFLNFPKEKKPSTSSKSINIESIIDNILES